MASIQFGYRLLSPINEKSTRDTEKHIKLLSQPNVWNRHIVVVPLEFFLDLPLTGGDIPLQLLLLTRVHMRKLINYLSDIIMHNSYVV